MGSLIRAREDFFTYNDKPTEFLLNLKNVNFVFKLIRELKTDNNRLVHQQGEILREMHTF